MRQLLRAVPGPRGEQPLPLLLMQQVRDRSNLHLFIYWHLAFKKTSRKEIGDMCNEILNLILILSLIISLLLPLIHYIKEKYIEF